MIESDITVGTGLRITCTKNELVQGLGLVGRAVSSRTAIQILSGILLEAAGDELRLAATDMELSLRAAVPAQVEGDGAVVLPGRTLVDIARLLPGDEVTIEHKAAESVVHIGSGSASYTLHTYNAEDFPRLPEFTEAETFAVDRDALLATIARVARAASRDEARPVLTGVLVQFAGDKLVMAATDSYRLAVKETTLASAAPDLEAIVPSRALQELARIPGDGDEISVGVQENQVLFSTAGVWLTTRRIDGQFPNYRQLLPETFEHELTVPRAELLEVVRRAAVMIQRRDAAAAALRGRRGHRRGADTRGRRVEGVDAGRLQRRAARDWLQRRVPARRSRVGGRRGREAEAHQPAAAGDPHRRGRRLHVPHHADPPSRLKRRTGLAESDRRIGLAKGLPLV